jgi:hypothetical protein
MDKLPYLCARDRKFAADFAYCWQAGIAEDNGGSRACYGVRAQMWVKTGFTPAEAALARHAFHQRSLGVTTGAGGASTAELGDSMAWSNEAARLDAIAEALN